VVVGLDKTSKRKPKDMEGEGKIVQRGDRGDRGEGSRGTNKL
jgi:hypothetical protein